MNQPKTPGTKNRPKNRNRRGHYKDSPVYEYEILIRWTSQATIGPKQGSDVFKWMENWDRLRREAIRLGLESEDSRRPCLFFLECIREVLPDWWEMQYYNLVLHKEPVELRLLMEEFRAVYSALQLAKTSQS